MPVTQPCLPSSTFIESFFPWWMQHIHRFDGLELRRSKIIGRSALGKEILWPCDDESASLWGVYGLNKKDNAEAGFEVFEKFNAEEAAQSFYDTLLAAYPHLNRSKSASPIIPALCV